MKRVWYRDGSYTDVGVSYEYENDPDWEKTEEIKEGGEDEMSKL